ncbi:hypothetical protein [Rhizobium leguminosarum]|uniref:Integral membrane protein n=1 Tax=Rhizobium leguminosarum TaxID=384 RepID=A0A7W9ZSX8_RHILE|nr:hypothetical protein [Rhizobium leguminosarum]MBB6221137.1 hypothetical protein [Rhizobium leguminosarum]
MANTAFQSRSDASTVTPAQVSVPILSATVAVFAAVSFLLCMLLGFVAPEWGLHKPWLQFFLGLTGFDLRSLALGIVQSVVFGGYAGALLGTIFNVISRRFG